nr:hypothetical protein [Tanacetum cinerariifolium]
MSHISTVAANTQIYSLANTHDLITSTTIDKSGHIMSSKLKINNWVEQQIKGGGGMRIWVTLISYFRIKPLNV